MLLLTFLYSCQRKQGSSAENANPNRDTLTITGTLAQSNGDPFESDEEIILHKVKDGGISYETDGSGVLLNPISLLSTNGSFVLRVHRSFIIDTAGETCEFTLRYRGHSLQNSSGAMITFKVDKAQDTLDINKLLGEIIVKY
jgi:hypothetical protein